MAVYAVNRPKALREVEITRLRPFPSVGELNVHPGDAVQPDTVLGAYASRQRLRFVRVESSAGRITATVLVTEGQKVKRGEVLAYYSFMFGLGYTEYTSPCDGEIVSISQATGQISIKEEPSGLASHLPGVVERVDEALGAWIRLRGDLVYAAAGAGFGRSGVLVKVAESGSPASPQKVGPGDAGKILLAGSSVTQEFLEACLKYRVAGVIAGSAPYRVFEWYENLVSNLDWDEFLARYWARELKSKDAVVPRATEIAPALVILEGFGDIAMSPDTFDLLAANEGSEVFVDGSGAMDKETAVSLGAGPCVIVPKAQPSAGASEASRATAVHPAALKEVTVGAKVRVTGVVQTPVEGVVHALHEEVVAMPNGITVPGVTVLTAGGTTVTVPVANIQLIE